VCLLSFLVEVKISGTVIAANEFQVWQKISGIDGTLEVWLVKA
jgi:hypothetical protein